VSAPASGDQVEPVEADPYTCEACVAAGDLCSFHAGFAAGWDACTGLVARLVNEGAVA
jgi:hypothetical protein